MLDKEIAWLDKVQKNFSEETFMEEESPYYGEVQFQQAGLQGVTVNMEALQNTYNQMAAQGLGQYQTATVTTTAGGIISNLLGYGF